MYKFLSFRISACSGGTDILRESVANVRRPHYTNVASGRVSSCLPEPGLSLIRDSAEQVAWGALVESRSLPDVPWLSFSPNLVSANGRVDDSVTREQCLWNIKAHAGESVVSCRSAFFAMNQQSKLSADT